MKSALQYSIIICCCLISSSVWSQSFKEAGYEKLARGDAEGARAEFDWAVITNPNDSEAWFGRARSKEFLGDKKGAFEDYSRSIDIKPSVGAYVNRGQYKLWLYNDIDGAREDFLKAKALDPSHWAPTQSLKELKEWEDSHRLK